MVTSFLWKLLIFVVCCQYSWWVWCHPWWRWFRQWWGWRCETEAQRLLWEGAFYDWLRGHWPPCQSSGPLGFFMRPLPRLSNPDNVNSSRQKVPLFADFFRLIRSRPDPDFTSDVTSELAESILMKWLKLIFCRCCTKFSYLLSIWKDFQPMLCSSSGESIFWTVLCCSLPLPDLPLIEYISHYLTQLFHISSQPFSFLLIQRWDRPSLIWPQGSEKPCLSHCQLFWWWFKSRLPHLRDKKSSSKCKSQCLCPYQKNLCLFQIEVSAREIVEGKFTFLDFEAKQVVPSQPSRLSGCCQQVSWWTEQ